MSFWNVIFVELNNYTTCYSGKNESKFFLAISAIFQKNNSKQTLTQWANGRKFAQSGYPGVNPESGPGF
jgi:hypothetical protein